MGQKLLGSDISKINTIYSKMVNDKSRFVFIINQLLGNTEYVEERIQEQFNYIMRTDTEVLDENLKSLLLFNQPTLLSIRTAFPDWNFTEWLLNNVATLNQNEKEIFASFYNTLVIKNIIPLNSENKKQYVALTKILLNRSSAKYYQENESILGYIKTNQTFDDSILQNGFVSYISNNPNLVINQTPEFKELVAHVKDLDFSEYDNQELIESIIKNKNNVTPKTNVGCLFMVDFNDFPEIQDLKKLERVYINGIKGLIASLSDNENVISKTYGYKDKVVKLGLKLAKEDTLFFDKVKVYLSILKEYQFTAGDENFDKIWKNCNMYVNLQNIEHNGSVIKTKKVKI